MQFSDKSFQTCELIYLVYGICVRVMPSFMTFSKVDHHFISSHKATPKTKNPKVYTSQISTHRLVLYVKCIGIVSRCFTNVFLKSLQCLRWNPTHWHSLFLYIKCIISEPCHDKTNKMSVRPAKTQISLGIRPVWSESSLSAQWVAKDPRFILADSEDSDQTGRMRGAVLKS